LQQELRSHDINEQAPQPAARRHGQANAYPVIVEWLFTSDTETAKQLLTTATQSSR
jgi:hypothetical protein